MDRRLRQLRIEFYRNSLHYYTSVLSSVHLIAPFLIIVARVRFLRHCPLYNDYLSLNRRHRRVRWVKLFTVASHYFFFINCVLLVTTMI